MPAPVFAVAPVLAQSLEIVPPALAPPGDDDADFELLFAPRPVSRACPAAAPVECAIPSATAPAPSRPKAPRATRATAVCNCSRASHPGTSGRHAQYCPVSRPRGSAASVLPGAPALSQPAGAPVSPSECDPVPTPPPPALAPFEFPSLETIAAFAPPLLLAVPPATLPGLSLALSSLLAGLSATDPAPWVRLALFARCVLSRPSRRGRALGACINRRLRLWSLGRYAELWDEVKSLPRTLAVAGTSLPHDCTALPLPRDAAFVLGTQGAPAPRDIAACIRWAHLGAFSRAVSALGAASPAPEDAETLAALAALHPASPPFAALPPVGETDQPAPASLHEVRSALHSFSRFSAGGLSLLCPRVLLACSELPGSGLLEALRRPVDLFLRGAVPVSVRPFFFGARLTALKKPKGGVRPVACGDVLRRLCGKVLAAREKRSLRAFFLPHSQVGVAVPGGADIAASLARCALLLPGAAFLKYDFKNAFNCVHRGAVLAACRRVCPTWSPHVEAAYGSPSWLFFGAHCISSCGGVQQGDVLGPALFSMVLADVAAFARSQVVGGLSAEVWYLDDGFVAGSPAAVEQFSAALALAGPEVGLHLNLGKCEQFGSASVAGVPSLPLSEFFLLGVPCGPRVAALAWAEAVASRVSARCADIAAVPDTHVALVLLRLCGGFPMANFALRAVGPCAAWPRLDLGIRAAAETVIGPLDDVHWQVAQLAVSAGGLGLRASSAFAPLALAAASCASAPVVRTLWPSACLSGDPALGVLDLESSTPAPIRAAIVGAMQVWSAPVPSSCLSSPAPKWQRLWSTELCSLTRDELLASLPPPARAVLEAHSAESSAGWLCPMPAPDASYLALQPLWFTPAETIALVRRRLGLSASASSSPSPPLCPLCSKVPVSDDHMLTCMSGGLRKRLSDHVVDAVCAVFRGGGTAVSKEPTCFPTAPTRRADLLVRLGAGEAPLALDVAVTHAFLGDPDGYCPSKIRVYGPLAAEAGLRFVPAVWDTAGGLSKDAFLLLRAAAARWGRRYDVHPSHAVPMALATINRVLMRGLAGILLRGLCASPGPGE